MRPIRNLASKYGSGDDLWLGHPRHKEARDPESRRCRHRPVQYLNNILEQDHRAIKRRVNQASTRPSFPRLVRR